MAMADDTSRTLAQTVRACREGDQDAWRALLERLAPLIFSICRDSRLSQEESLDIFGQVSFLLVTHIHRVRSASKIFSYVGTITRRQIYNRYYKDRLLDFVDSDQLQDTQEDDAPGPDQRHTEEKKRQLLLEAVASLPEREFKLLQALFFDETEPSYEKIARKLNMPVASIGPTRGRALRKLRRLLKQKGYHFDVF